jgi:hypothetical protein
LSSQGAPGTGAFDVAAIMGGFYGDGIIGVKAAFDRAWVAELAEDVGVLFDEALARPHGTVGRGPRRHYVAIHPERLRGFADLVSHPWVTAVCEAVLGEGYEFVEVGFDVPLPGAVVQPWHRDFAAPPATLEDRRLDSIAFNVTTVDVTEDMGPFEVAPGTEWDDASAFEHGMFPPRSAYGRYEALAQRKLPQMGDISARSGLTVHRGTANRSDRARPVLILGAVAPSSRDPDAHDLRVTQGFLERLSPAVRAHLGHRVVHDLSPIEQAYTIEGLVMGAA